ncbi:MAG TPA: CYCYC family (seleno)protein, partial [Rhizomicrobium sp.]|nr:CYCYC family (seleno)protein [Rhizomicrobium sp.]
MPKTKKPPTGGKQSKRSKRTWIVAAVAAVAVLSIGAVAWTMRSAADPAAATAKGERPTLDPARFFGAARQAYEVAEKNPALLAQLHCYCGCDKEMG